MRLIFMGTADFAVPALEALHGAGHEIPLVICQPDRPKGRGHQLQAPPLKAAALALGLEVFQPPKIREAGALEKLKAAGCDVLCVVAYGQILPQAALDAPRLMPLNVHASLLPKYRGAAPIEWAIAMGESETGVCVQKMAYKLDSGDVMLSESLAIGPGDDAASLTPRLAQMGAKLLLEALGLLQSGKARLQPQDEARASFAPLLKKSHGIADFGLGAGELANRFRAFKARPGFYTAFGGETLKIHALSQGAETSSAMGALIESGPRGLRVGCGRGESIWLEALQSPGGKVMPAADWARGHLVKTASLFETPVF